MGAILLGEVDVFFLNVCIRGLATVQFVLMLVLATRAPVFGLKISFNFRCSGTISSPRAPGATALVEVHVVEHPVAFAEPLLHLGLLWGSARCV